MGRGRKAGLGCAIPAGLLVLLVVALLAHDSRSPGIPLDFSDIPSERAQEPNTIGIFFCIDISSSMEGKTNGTEKMLCSQRALELVFSQIGEFAAAHPEKKIKAGMCTFGSQPTLLLPLSLLNLKAARSAVAKLHPGGATGIGRAIGLAVMELMKSGDETKAIIVLTDGQNNSGRSPAQIIEAIKKNNNTKKLPTADVDVSLIAFDVQSSTFDDERRAGANVVESSDEKSLKEVMKSMVEEVLLEAS